MAKKTEVQRAIDATEAEMRVLQQVLDRLKVQQAAKPARTKKPRVVAMSTVEAGR